MGVDQTRQQQPVAEVDRRLVAVGRGQLGVRPAGHDRPLPDHDRAVGLGPECRGTGGEGVAGDVETAAR